MLRKFKNYALATASAGALVMGLGAGSAHAIIPLGGWTLDLFNTDIDGLATDGIVTDEIEPIDEVGFKGIFKYEVTTDGGTVGSIDAGDVFNVRGFVSTTGFTKLGGAAITDFGVGTPGQWEMTMDFDITGVFTSGASPFEFTHIAGGILKIYVDNLSDMSGAQADGFLDDAGASYMDGVHIATFVDGGGLGGNVDEVGGGLTEGLDKAGFAAAFLLPGVWLNAGDDLKDYILAPLGEFLTLALVDSNLDDFGNGFKVFKDDCDVNTTTGAPLYTATEVLACGNEDGSASLALQLIPEPSAMAGFGIGLLGLAGLARRRRKAA